MKKNIGLFDKIIRIIVAILIGGAYFIGTISGIAALVLLGVAVILIVTAYIGTCILYLPFGISTKKKGLSH